jgi:hypothetical protein
MTTQVVAINEDSVDLNALFNFDLLKRTIELLILNQKVTNQKIIDLEAKLANVHTDTVEEYSSHYLDIIKNKRKKRTRKKIRRRRRKKGKSIGMKG